MEQVSPTTEPAPRAHTQKIEILQITTDSKLVEQSQQLENALQMGNLIEYCNFKIEISPNNGDKDIWRFILVRFIIVNLGKVCQISFVLLLFVFEF
jgi:hypothetical protein